MGCICRGRRDHELQLVILAYLYITLAKNVLCCCVQLVLTPRSLKVRKISLANETTTLIQESWMASMNQFPLFQYLEVPQCIGFSLYKVNRGAPCPFCARRVWPGWRRQCRACKNVGSIVLPVFGSGWSSITTFKNIHPIYSILCSVPCVHASHYSRYMPMLT